VLVGYLAQSVFSLETPATALLFWVAAGCLVAAVDPVLRAQRVATGRRKPPKRGRPGRKKGFPMAAVGGAAVVALALLVYAGRLFVADLHAGRAARKDGADALAEADAAAGLAPWEVAYRVRGGNIAERMGAEAETPEERGDFLRTAIDRYRQALEIQPRSLLPTLGLARSYTLAGRGVNPSAFPDAEKWWTAAAALDPNDGEVHAGYGLMMNSWANAGRPEKRAVAIEELRASLAIRPTVETYVNLTRILQATGDRAGARQVAAEASTVFPDSVAVRTLVAAP
jgi:tetratricopeptide (TPR) repeat protein